jgi:ribosomal RNA methyltransferase Nop2
MEQDEFDEEDQHDDAEFDQEEGELESGEEEEEYEEDDEEEGEEEGDNARPTGKIVRGEDGALYEEVLEEVENDGQNPDDESEDAPPMTLNTQEVIEQADLHLIKVKIQEILKVLQNLSTKREESKPRYEYLDELKELFCRYYGYSDEVMQIFISLFSPHETQQFLEANEDQRPLTIRTNTLKTKRKDLAQALIQRGVQLEPVGDWSKVGIKINETKVPIGATPEYLCGHYMIQSAASFLPVLALAPHPGDKVLDMAAAPGGKTTYIAQMMKNKGILIANDYKKERLRAVHFNVQRMGITNCAVTNYDGRKMPKIMKGFDRVLLDAPCSCLGVLARYPAAKASRAYIDVYKAAHLQRELLRAAIDCCKVGGYVLYSTCSVAVEENEAVVDYALKNRHCKIVETGLPEEIEGQGYTKYQDRRFTDKMKLTRRVYPHVENMDGFYIAKLKKTKDGVRVEGEELEVKPAVKKVKKSEKNSDKKGKKGEKKGKKGEKGEKSDKNGKKGDKGKKKAKKPVAATEEDATLAKRPVAATETAAPAHTEPKKKVKSETPVVPMKLADMSVEEKRAKLLALKKKLAAQKK